MRHFTIDELIQIMDEAKMVVKYTLDHHDELMARKAKYTLYGRGEFGIGEAMPGYSGGIKRDLRKSNRRSIYYTYEIDSDYNLLRVYETITGNDGLQKKYHGVEYNGKRYFCKVVYYNGKINVEPSLYVIIGGKESIPEVLGELILREEMGCCLTIMHYFQPFSDTRMEVTRSRGYFSYYSDKIKCKLEESSWEEDIVYTDFKKVCKKLFEGESTDETEKDEEKIPVETIASWIDRILGKEIPVEVEAFCFNLYDHCDNESWDMELVGTDSFDLDNSDWACGEVTDFESRQDLYEWDMECTWDKALEFVVKEIKEYLETGKYADVLKSRKGVGVGFVDGDLEIVYTQKN